MAPVSAPNRGNPGRVARGCKPVMNSGANLAALDRRLSRAMMAGDQHYHALAARDRPLKPGVDCPPGAIEVQAVKVDHSIGLNPAAAELPVPASIQRLIADRHGARADHRRLSCRDVRRTGFPGKRRSLPNGSLSSLLPGQRPNRRGDAGPKRGFVRAERAHGPQRPWAPGSTPHPWPTCRRRSLRPRSLNPRMYRSGWDP